MRSRNYLKIHLLLVLSSLLLSFSAHTQETVVDTLVSIGSHNLHFTYYQGEGIPILFEAGAGDDGSSWSELAKEVHICWVRQLSIMIDQVLAQVN